MMSFVFVQVLFLCKGTIDSKGFKLLIKCKSKVLWKFVFLM